ncbi:MAG: choice-of-anchor D domain-containing protein [Myxococcales bacterium]
MRIIRTIAFLFLSSATACNCAHRGQQLVPKDATPQVTPNPVEFGSAVHVGVQALQQVTLENVGSLDLDISSVQIVQPSGGGPAQFGFGPHTNSSAPFGTALPPSAKAGVTMFCQPSGNGLQQGSLVIRSNSSATPTYSVPLHCTGVSVDIAVQPPNLDFGPVQVGTTSTLPVQFTNLGSSTSGLIALQPVSGTQAAEFSYTGTGSTLAANASFSLQVSFTPTAQGPASALIQYQDQSCPTCPPQSISLMGEGVDGQLVYDPNPVSLNAPANSQSQASVTLTNIGTAAVRIAAGGLFLQKGAPFALSSIAPPLPVTLVPVEAGGTPLTFTVTYTATAAGNDSDTIEADWVPLDASANPVTGISPRQALDPVSGNGTLNPCSIQVKPPSLNFGNATVGTPATLSVTVTDVGQQSCQVSQIAVGGDPAFTLVGSQTSFTLAPGANQTIAVQCDVQNGGPPLLRRGDLTFQSTDTTQPSVTVPLTAYLKGSGPYLSGWPKWHNDNTDQGQSAADTSGNQGTVLWQFRVGVPQSAGGLNGLINPNPTYMNSPVVDEYGNVYQLGMDGTFYAVDPGGNELWTATLAAPNPDEHPATPIIAADDTIYLESGCDGTTLAGGQLYHIDAKTGNVLFAASPPTTCRYDGACQSDSDCNGGTCDTTAGQCCFGADGFDVNPSIGNDGLLFDGDDFGQVVTYSTTSGGSFSQANGTILQFFGERVAVAIDQNDNSYWCCLNVCFGVTAPSAGFAPMAAWPSSGQAVPGSSGNSNPAAFTNSDLAYDQSHTGWLIVEAGTQTGNSGQTFVAAMDPTNGNIQWQTPLPSGTTPGSMNVLTGAGIFSSDVGNSSPAISSFPGQSNDGVAYVGNVDGLHALDVHTGKEISGWPFKTPSDVDSAPAIGGDGTIFFGSADGTFYAVNPDGTKRFSYKTGGRISSSPAIGPDGTVFFVADDGQLYAIR